MSNSSRFINAYNRIDKALREDYNFKPSLGFVDVVRKASGFNGLVKKFEDELLSYGRLRNAIVHDSDATRVIAEPHISVTEHIERIASILTKPPKAIDFAHKAVHTEAGESLGKVMRLMVGGDYSNLPVIKDGTVIGVVTNKMLVTAIEKHLDENLNEFLELTSIDLILFRGERVYDIADDGITAIAAIEKFTANRKLAILILTADGTAYSEIIGVLTPSDVTSLTKAIS